MAGLALREAACLRAILAQGPDAVCDLALGACAALQPDSNKADVAAALRAAKRHVALATAVADIGGAWTLEQVTGTLSDLAETALRVVVRHLLHGAAERGLLRLPHPAAPDRGSGFTVLAMGKLGARELNFSSDVDLILLWDAGAHPYTEESNGATFSRLARDLVSLMQAPDAGGIVFRTDLRLRPDPASTPPAVRLDAALSYYESTAQTWERAAMIKARPVAGDLALGRRFLQAIRPFVWRRHLDFAALADIRAMKARMDAQKNAALRQGSAMERVLGHDLKLGQGGIREIEFCAQSLQLVWGGRDATLRAPGTLAALQALQAAGHLQPATRAMLEDAYRLLRRAEHRLQMVADRQTHAMPSTPEGFTDLAAFFGEVDPAGFAETLLTPMKRVHAAFSGLLAVPMQPPDLGAPGQAGSANAPADGPDAPAALSPVSERAGSFGQAPSHGAETGGVAAAPVWENWLNGRPRALRTERARALLHELLPSIRQVMDAQPDPRAAWVRLDDFIHQLPAGVQVFSLLQHNPALLERLGAVLGAAPSLAEHLAEVPAALEGFLAPRPVDPQPNASLRAQLDEVRPLDAALNVASRFVRGEEFRLAVAELDGRIGQDAAGMARSALAEAAVSVLLPRVLAEHRRRYGRVPGGGMSVVALGKAGSREMMAGSDLDLMLVYDHPAEPGESDGRVRLAASQYFARAAQALVAALTVPTRDGKLYDVDMRLRPSGGKGPVAVSLASFARYHRESAWTWERLALTRARVVAGPPALRRRVATAIGEVLKVGAASGGQAAEDQVAADTLAMRRRQVAENPHPGFWDIKLRRGGLMELEFVAQSLQLRLGASMDVFDPVTRRALRKLARAGVLERAEAASLVAADAGWRAVQGLLRIALGRGVPEAVPPVLEARLLRALDRVPGLPEHGTLRERIEAIAATVQASFVRHVGEVGERRSAP